MWGSREEKVPEDVPEVLHGACAMVPEDVPELLLGDRMERLLRNAERMEDLAEDLALHLLP